MTIVDIIGTVIFLGIVALSLLAVSDILFRRRRVAARRRPSALARLRQIARKLMAHSPARRRERPARHGGGSA
jgi:hypothetical protein